MIYGVKKSFLDTCELWQYGLWSFQTGGTKLKRCLPKEGSTYSKENIEI